MQNILLIGGKGNLGTQLAKLLPNAISIGSKDLDIRDKAAIQKKLSSLTGIDTIINCAAFNDLDAAEENPEAAFALNETAARNLAEVAKDLNITLVHFSTGYVFSGEDGRTAYDETAEPSPNSIYSNSKLAGEKAIQNSGVKYYIIRTNLLFGPQGESDSAKKSVVDVMLNIGKEKKMLRGITDERSNFTYTPDLAKATVDLLKSKRESGIYHITNEGSGSWYDLAKQIFLSIGWNVIESNTGDLPEQTIVIEKITGADYPRKAKRPANAVILNTKLHKLRPWQEALKEYLNQ